MEADRDQWPCAQAPGGACTRLGRMGVPMLRLGLGTASMAGVNMVGAAHYAPPSDAAIGRILAEAASRLSDAAGARCMLDTSAQYGASEERLGAYLAAHPAAGERFVFATKWGLRFHPEDFSRQDYSPANLRESTARSARLLGRIDLLYLHTNPGVATARIVGLLEGSDGVVDTMCAMRQQRRHGIRALGLSLSSVDTVERLLCEPRLLAPFDVIQLNANIVLQRPDLARALSHFDFGIVLNSPYRKADPGQRSSEQGRRALCHALLDAAHGTLVLTGTIDPAHLSENVAHLRSWLRPAEPELRYRAAARGPWVPAVESALRELLAEPAAAARAFREGCRGAAPPRTAPAGIAERIVDVLAGSRKTRIGAAPSPAQRGVLRARVAAYVERGRPVAAFLTWGPRKFRAGGSDNTIDVSELAALARLARLHNEVARIHPPGMRFSLFLEDFEGCYIESEPAAAFAPYVTAMDRLVAALGLNGIVRTVHTLDLLAHDGWRQEVLRRLEENRRAIERYWIESDERGIDASEQLASYRDLCALGFSEPIDARTRRFYLGRLDRLLGDTRSPARKLAMTVRLLACVLMHRQTAMFDLHDGAQPVKLSLLPIAGGPGFLTDGRIDIRTLSTDVTRRCLAPWSAKGYLRLRGAQVLPAVKTWSEAMDEGVRLAAGELRLARGSVEVRLRADFLPPAQGGARCAPAPARQRATASTSASSWRDSHSR